MPSCPLDIIERHLDQIPHDHPAASLPTVLAQIHDPRKKQGIRHQLIDVLMICVCAVIAGAKGFQAICDWPHIHRDTLDWLPARLPSIHTIRRLLGIIDPDQLDTILGCWTIDTLHTNTTTTPRAKRPEPVVVAIDGKEVRGAKNAGQPKVHLLAGLTHREQAVIGQVSVGAKTNEIPCVKDLLHQIDSHHRISGMVVTLDALHTQTATAKLIDTLGGVYVLTVKANQPHLYQACKDLPWTQIHPDMSRDRGHGRRVTRSLRLLQAPATIGFPHALWVAKIRRTRTIKGETGWEEVFVITNHLHPTYRQLSTWVQRHWSIENELHWERDVVWGEDKSQVRTGTRPRVMASLRNLAITRLGFAGVDNMQRTLTYLWANPVVTSKLVGL